MKRLILALVASVACFGSWPTSASGVSAKDKAIHHLASAMAFGRLCPQITTDKIKAALLMKVADIDPYGADGDKITDEAMKVMASLREKSEETNCATGILLYGPNGRSIHGLVRMVN